MTVKGSVSWYYVIEGERPPQDRIQRWGQALGQAGQTDRTADALLNLQRVVIGRDTRFLRLGWRDRGGFVGNRDRDTNAPLPDHIGARPDDLPDLMRGLLEFARKSESGGLDPIVAAACLAFGFAFIHPFEDGNGRVHRWLLHHVLARRGFNPVGVNFPISSVFLARIEAYRATLEHFSRPRLALTQWETTPDLNVRVLYQLTEPLTVTPADVPRHGARRRAIHDFVSSRKSWMAGLRRP